MRKLFVLFLIFLGFLNVFSCIEKEEDKNLKENGVLTFAITGKYPPFNFINNKNELVGFDVDIANEVAERIGMQAKPVTTAWDGIIAGLLAEKFDMICGSMAINKEREKSVDFTIPYYRSGAQLFIKKDSKIKSIDDFKKGMVLGVTLGTTFEEWVRKNKPKIKVYTYKGGVPSMMVELLQSGRIDGFITDKIVGLVAIKEKKVPIKPIGKLLYEEKIGIALRKDSDFLRKKVNKALKKMFKDGTYKKISKKWIGSDIR
jgi:polar amino acid transport system substrate-binding protein